MTISKTMPIARPIMDRFLASLLAFLAPAASPSRQRFLDCIIWIDGRREKREDCDKDRRRAVESRRKKKSGGRGGSVERLEKGIIL